MSDVGFPARRDEHDQTWLRPAAEIRALLRPGLLTASCSLTGPNAGTSPVH